MMICYIRKKLTLYSGKIHTYKKYIKVYFKECLYMLRNVPETLNNLFVL